ncbi:type II toxin-antitoxin system HicA family toxin [Ornithobacterium rhinotracheale]|uniref:type II toxin-antitoxin system HicA family toxin n=1 Tax=Ornithobacterium rhinotracheale TaxID=28251 RepID=UPI00129C7812|nr:type II toxin-antitoxin system HicA family toxin [Ornithobacterium rhinotracheale]MRJ09081.1 type II toxin-antitoxin system HicA family toxin [Ornithobacterium rhinotracheale]MRJ09760.1 type II toxin-antitoxin system HicA family toxin [Ornithobacterium rhinotracheale]UOH77852.1 type II toxin-antitoxin system HicA family toxin [Ornithobacterium rhinotracheale]
MKYSELEKKLKKNGCYDTGKQINGHPVWFSPITKKKFKMSNHKSQEVKTGTLQSILKSAGVK